MSGAQKPITTEHLAGVSGKRVAYKDVVALLGVAAGRDAAGKDISTSAGGPDGAVAGEPAETRVVKVKHRKELEEKIPHLADALKRAVVINEQAWPWRTIGKVFVGANNNFSAPIWSGSGVLVGKNLILTAGHVAPWGLGGWWMRFVPAFKNGAEPFGYSYVENFYGYREDGEVHGRDYVICQLYTPLGNTVGWMGSHSFGSDDGYYSGSWISVGYPAEPGTNPGANYMIVQQPVRIADVDDEGSDGKELESDMYSLGGWSGGPLWANMSGQNKVIGIMSGDETDFLQPRYTVSAGGIAMVRLVQYGQANWPA